MKIIKQDLNFYIYPGKYWYIIWRKNGLSHREDGPATMCSYRDEYYYLNNCKYAKDEYWREVHENY